jgi:hypothetical protein
MLGVIGVLRKRYVFMAWIERSRTLRGYRSKASSPDNPFGLWGTRYFVELRHSLRRERGRVRGKGLGSKKEFER